MSLWPQSGPPVMPILAPWNMFPFSVYTLNQTATSGVTLFTVNLAVYFPVPVSERCRITRLWWVNGNTLNGNVDVGVYDSEANRLVSTGSTVQAGVSTAQIVTIATTDLPAGICYFAFVANSGTARYLTGGSLANGPNVGIRQQASAFPLPATATFASCVTTPLPKFGAIKAPRTVL